MKVAIGITLVALLSSCQSPHLETPLENLAPSIVYPEASVYRLLAAPRELEGIQIRTYGFVTFGGNGETGFLFASRDDARERAPTNWIELTFSSAIAHKPWFRRFVTEKRLCRGWIVGTFHNRQYEHSAPDSRLRLEDVTEFDVQSDEKE